MKVSVLGCGVVGGGVWEGLEAAGFERGPALVRPGKPQKRGQTADFEDILGDPAVEAVAEAIGGVEPALGYCTAALRAGKSVVTANKALVAACGPELAALARKSGAAFLFSAACGGGVPFLPNLVPLRGGARAVGGVLNGTTNFILDAMQRRRLAFDEALDEARACGYAEADAGADLSGLDSARKLALACAVGFSLLPAESQVAREGIGGFTAADAVWLGRRGLCCRLTAQAERSGASFYAVVQPTLYGADAPESALRGCDNLARYDGPGGPVALSGAGAGRAPTAAAVLRDLWSIRRDKPVMLPAGCRRAVPDNRLLRCRYLFRLPAARREAVSGRALRDGERVWVRTAPLPVAEAHELAARLRAAGTPVFFAALAAEAEA